MKVVLADGREMGFRTQYDLAKFVLFGAPRLGIPITKHPFLKVTTETLPLFRIKRRIDRLKEQQELEKLPF
ncbi:MAG: hypothetical protein ACRC6V_05650 [Bacteroidales bacterium]